MVDVRHVPCIDFLNGMIVKGAGATEGLDLAIAVFLNGAGVLGAMVQENILQMDEKGARVESGTAGVSYRSESPEIRGPFLFVLERNGMIDFVALCAEDSFRDPKRNNPLNVQDSGTTVHLDTTHDVTPSAHTPAPVPTPASSPAPASSTGFSIFV
jgi:hypothetical protein